MNIGELFVRVGADTSGLQRGMRQAEGSVRSFGRATQSINFDRLRGPLTTLAGQLTGLSPAFGSLTGTLLSMSAGGGIAAGAIAGFALIGGAMRKMGEDVREANKALEDTAKQLDDLSRKRAVGGQLAAFEGLVEARTERRAVQDQIDERQAKIAGRSAVLFAAANEKVQKEIDALNVQLALWDRRIREAQRAMEGAIPEVEGITVSIERLKRASLSDFAGPGLNAFAEGQRPGQPVRQPEWVRKILALNLQPSVTGGAGGGALDNAVGKFRDAVDSFSDGVKEMVKGTFSKEGLANIGQNLAAQGIGFLAGKAIEKVGSLFNSASERLAAAMEQNTRALRATAEFLSAQLTGSGLTEEASAIAKVIQDVINQVAVGGPNKILTIFNELEKAGISLETFHAVAKQLGIDSSSISLETLQQFLDALTKAGAGLEEFGKATGAISEALRNVPEIWSAALARFRVTTSGIGGVVGGSLRDRTLGRLGLPQGGQFVFNGDIILPGVRSGADFYREVETEAVRRTARGGSPVLGDSLRRRVGGV